MSLEEAMELLRMLIRMGYDARLEGSQNSSSKDQSVMVIVR